MASDCVDGSASLLQLKDVYRIAQQIGEQFQKLIKNLGSSYTEDLLDTVIKSLEHLENYVEEVNKLKRRVCKLLLDNDNSVKENERMKLDLDKNTVS